MRKGRKTAQLGFPEKHCTMKSGIEKRGRKKMNPALKTDQLVKSYVTKKEFDGLLNEYMQSGSRSFSSFIRKKLTSDKDSALTMNPGEFLKALDVLGRTIREIGASIDETSKYIKKAALNDKIEPQLFEKHARLMDEYIKTRKELTNTFRAAFRKL